MAVDEANVRAVTTYYDLGCAITALRMQHGYPPSKAASGTVRLNALEKAEQALGCTIPDPIVAYVSSGLGSIRRADEIIGLTEQLLAQLDGGNSVETATRIAFDLVDGDYLTFQRGADQDDESIAVCLHREGYDTTDTTVMEWVTDQLDEKVAQTVERFELTVDGAAEPEPDETWVTHSKFGRGTVVASEPTTQGRKLTVRFTDDGEVRKLLERFVTFD